MSVQHGVQISAKATESELESAKSERGELRNCPESNWRWSENHTYSLRGELPLPCKATQTIC